MHERVYKILVKKPEGRPKHRRKDNIKMDLIEYGGEYGLDSHGSEQGPVAGSYKQDTEPSNFIKNRKFYELMTTDFSRRILFH